MTQSLALSYFQVKILAITVIKMAGLEISGLRTHEMGKLKGDGFVVSCFL